ncbi:MAG: GNAT family N-acetyltransferase [Clostridia bacterium]|nr:GNAT family N-acetyltransferase [Clostridia bacterium]
MYITHQRLTLRNAVTGDAPQLAAWWNDGAVMAHAGFPMGLGTTPEKIARDLQTDSDDTRRRLMLLYDGTPIGEMCFTRLNNAAAEIDIKICNPAYQEKGIGRVALSLLIRALFAMGCEKIVLDTSPHNARARHVYEKLGFRQTGIRENCWQDQMGQWRSAVDYELMEANFVEFL